MKTRLLQMWRMATGIMVVPLLVGCVEDSTADSVQTAAPSISVAATNVAVAVATNDIAAVEAPENAPPPEHPVPAPSSENRPLPAGLKLSPDATEITKLAQAGVSESVMLAFVTNSTGTFNLGSDQIVYLNDLGVASGVITSMIEHDRLLREGHGTLPPVASAPAAPPPALQPPPPDAAAIAAAAAPQAVTQTMEATAPPPPATTEAVPAPPTSVTYNYFYDSLSPYGTWVDVEGYGYCWQPSVVVVNSGWRPYCDGGRWIYSDYGWYWRSDYTWGWAPFHYGRWFTHPRFGWCWYPDTVWGPSWVSWSYTDAYCGWAPLPPAAYYTTGVGFTYFGSSVGVSFGFGLGWASYAYVPWTHFHGHNGHHYERHCAPPHQAREIHGHARLANDYAAGRNHTPINRGIGEERIRQYTKTELRPARVREERVAATGSRVTPGDRLERGGRELVVRRPNLPQTPVAAAVPRGGRSEAVPASGSLSGGSREPRPEVSSVRTPEMRLPHSPANTALSPSSSVPVTKPAVPSNPQRTQPEVVQRPAPTRGSVTTIGRPDPTPRATQNATITRSPSPVVRANPATPGTQGAGGRADLAVNNPQYAPAPTPPSRPTFAPSGQRSTPSRVQTTPRQEPARVQAAPLPNVRSEPQMSAPPAPSAPQNIVRFPSSRSYSSPPNQPSPSPAPNFAPRSVPTPSPVAPAPRSTPTPSYSPAPARPAPSVAPSPSVPSAPRSSPSPPPSSSGSPGRSGGGGRGNQER